MRTIKFRGKRADNGEWVYGDLNQKPIRYACQIIENGVIHHSVDPNTVGQFIGLHDKNGKEIYEGDNFEVVYSNTPDGYTILNSHKIIKCIPSSVVYKFGSFMVQFIHPETNNFTYMRLSDFLKNPKEITGNIHENK